MPASSARRSPVWLVLVLALGARLPGLLSRPIWYDEAFSILFSRRGLAAMLYGTLAPDALGSAADIHPLGYYALLGFWMRLFGESIPAARLLSILIGLLTVWAGVRFMKDRFGAPLAWWAGVFLALSPFLVHHGQEIRMYGLLALLLLLATAEFWTAAGLGRDASADPRLQHWLLFALYAAMAQYAHNLAVFYLFPLALIPVFRKDWGSARRAVLAGAGALLLYAPWLLQLPAQFAKVSLSYWTAPPDASRLVTTLLTFTTNLPLPPFLLPFALLLSVLMPVLALWQSIREYRANPVYAGLGLWLAYLAFAPPVLMFIVSQWLPVYIERALLPSGILFLLWSAWALKGTRIPSFVHKGVTVLLLAGFLLGIRQHLVYAGFPYAPYRELNLDLGARLSQGTVIIHANKLSALPAYLDDPDLPLHFVADLPGSGSDTLALPTQEVIGFLADPDIASAAGEASRVFWVVFEREIEEYSVLEGATHPQMDWLEAHYTHTATENWGDLLVAEYTRP